MKFSTQALKDFRSYLLEVSRLRPTNETPDYEKCEKWINQLDEMIDEMEAA